MRQQDFHTQLLAATFAALRFAEKYVVNQLSLDIEYVAELNSSFDDNRKHDEVIYPEDDGRFASGLSGLEVVELLYRDGRCPQWIDIRVQGASDGKTLLSLLCCGRYDDVDTRLYYYERGSHPFGIKSPTLPPGYVDGEKFHLMDITTGIKAACWKPGDKRIIWNPSGRKNWNPLSWKKT